MISMDIQHFFGVYLFLSIQGILFLAGVGTCSHTPFSSKDSSRNFISCLPCFRKYIAESYSEECDIFNSDFFELFHEESHSLESCKGLIHYSGSMLRLSALQRHLVGEGSHRHLVSSMEFDVHSDNMCKLSPQVCKVVAVERLPSGIFADSFELQHLVQRSVFADASAFGDTNLELPSALSNRSVIEVHMDISHKLLAQHEKDLKITVDLPLHTRYPPLDASGNGYSRIEIGIPHLFLHCEMEKPEHEYSLWTSVTWNTEFTSNEDTIWYIPCGDPAHAGIVSTVTFLSAISAVSIIFTAIYFKSNEIQLYQNY